MSDRRERVLTNPALLRAIGHELRTAREALGWTRAQLVAKLDREIHSQTIATYELGIRQCTLGRFVAICEALGIPAPDVLSTAMRQAGVEPHLLACVVDLRLLVLDHAADLEPLRRWARHRLDNAAESDESDEDGIVHLEPGAVAELAVFCGLTHLQLFHRLGAFAAEPRP
ncbi:helix-turn-helix domain-containing protein [Actinokineospora diospyrosa]|uniref:Helix-turn-helix domain-containing protein n=1 Tax=Actinokineospora diospyrosa TaxID=103728 RepID=A0ABT1ILJ9_9PSEU|nr:helix-turn-helix transcriptional regulator [Actinokineospora diospyrosa]MCP2273533.1 Helix-turn-helix domain-containing protein [Actinokineospora diospyrosa]